MKLKITLFSLLMLLCGAHHLLAQNIIKGEVTEEGTKEPLIGASILIKGTGIGVVTDFDGKFELDVRDTPFPLTLEISYVGYGNQDVPLTSSGEEVKVVLGESAITADVVEVKGRRISEKKKQSALTVETLDNIAIRETPAANFYDGLGSLKDVDLTAASLGFKIVNTRGFNSTSPVRSLQIIDGVDNQSPGLNFSLGNFLGSSELDVNSVNLIVGASSAFYGPNAFNGVISMQTKNPFLHKGVSAMAKIGERALFEGALRFADAFKNKNGDEFFAFKLNLFYMQANDWQADNFDPVFDSRHDETNPGGYDAVNIYGDEYDRGNDASGVATRPGLGTWYRRGYKESELVDYDSKNSKAAAALHFRLAPEKSFESPELILSSNFGGGTTVYQGDNRFSLRNIKFFQHRIELTKRDHYFIRAYLTHEDAGDSYDPYFTALKLQAKSKNAVGFSRDYSNYWVQRIQPRLSVIEGFPRRLDFPGDPQGYSAALNTFLTRTDVIDSLFLYHDLSQTAANLANPIDGSSSDFLVPGTQRYKDAFDDITGRIANKEFGTKFFDKSALVHAHGEYKFNNVYQGGSISNLDLLVGANFRQYMPNSDGSILLDTAGRSIDLSEFGIYGGGTLELQEKLRISASLRMDKNQNFDYLFSPAASLVYIPDAENVLRFSFSSAIRNPTLNEQYLFYNVGPAILLGNTIGVENLVTTESLITFLNTRMPETLDSFNVASLVPEKVKTLEFGYRTTLFEKLFLDLGYYFSFYDDFIGYNIGVDLEYETLTNSVTSLQAYRITANARDRVTTQGFSMGLNYYFLNYFVFNGNFSWNKLNTASDDPIIPAFNTPEFKYNIGVSGRDIQLGPLQNFGFNVNYKWNKGFLFEGSPQFTGFIPSYGLLDAQINWHAARINTTFKLGASNLLDEQTFQTYGGPRIGRLAYFSVIYDFKKK